MQKSDPINSVQSVKVETFQIVYTGDKKVGDQMEQLSGA